MKPRADIVIPSVMLVLLVISSAYMVYTGALLDENFLVGEYEQVYRAQGEYEYDGPDEIYTVIRVDEHPQFNFKITSVSNGFVYAETDYGPLVGILISDDTFYYTQIVNGNMYSGTIRKVDDYLVTQYVGIGDDGAAYSSVAVYVQRGWKFSGDPESLFPKIDPSLIDKTWPGCQAYNCIDGTFTILDHEQFSFTIVRSEYGMVFYLSDTPSGTFYFVGAYSNNVIQAIAFIPGSTTEYVKDTVTIADGAIYTSSAEFSFSGESRIYVVNYAEDKSKIAAVPEVDGFTYEGVRWTSTSDGTVKDQEATRNFTNQKYGVVTSTSDKITSTWLIVNNGNSVMCFASYRYEDGLVSAFSVFQNNLGRLVTVMSICNTDGSVAAVRVVMDLAKEG